MYSYYLYALAAFFLVFGCLFISALPFTNALLARYFKHQMLLVERVCFALALTIAFLAVAGIVISILPWEYRSVSSRTIIVFAIIAGGIFSKKKSRTANGVSQGVDVLFLIAFVALAGLCLALGLAHIKLPADLPDGAYVNKENVTAVKIQKYTGNLPADNVVPYVASEYLVRGISFRENHPILPGQEVTNRPILVSLAVVPIRAALAMPASFEGRVPTYSYAQTEWPDFRIFVRDEVGFSIFLSTGVIFNAALLLAAGSFARRCIPLSVASSATFCALYVTSPYFIFQTLFTWPKSLAAFFLVLALLSLLVYRSLPLVGVFLGLAYLSHPFAVAYVGIFLLFLILVPSISINRFKSATQVFLFAALLVLPWMLWSKFGVRLKSDLVSQNFIVPGQSVIDFLWVRVLNLVSTLQAVHLLHYPFNLQVFIMQASVNAIGALGGAPSLFLIPALVRLDEDRLVWAAILISAVSALLLTLIFSNPAVPALHGFQALFPLLLLIAIRQAEKIHLLFRSLLYLQILFNVVTIFVYTKQMLA